MSKCPTHKKPLLYRAEYTMDMPEHYDGISEWVFICGCRYGRWSGKLLKDGEYEEPFGRAVRGG